jgi:hypothetical protein
VAPYRVTTKTSGRLKAATYFLSDDPRLAEAYLDATLEYLVLYSELFGPYAFDQFAVVENFFPTGYGFPGYTLLGGRVLRLPFIIGTSLGHEVAHCWWGNGVTVDYSEGNWSEGLTTYVADYLYKERRSPVAAMAYRSQTLRNYASLVTPASEFPLAQFSARRSPLTKAIGYDKGTMVFHMLRRQIGEDAFWGGLRDVYRDRLFRKTAWSDLQAAFEKRAGRSLETFFSQWVARKGAPELRLLNVQLSRPRPTGPWVVIGKIQQGENVYSFPVDLRVHTASGDVDHTIRIQQQRSDFRVTSKTRPLKIELDPGVNLFRRLDRSEIPPTVNSLKSVGRAALLVAEAKPKPIGAAKTLAASLGFDRVDGLSRAAVEEKNLPPVDILVIGRPPEKGPLSGLIARYVQDSSAFRFNDQTYDHEGDVFFGVFRHPTAPHRVVGFFWPIGNEGAAIARKIAHYGKYSYLVFSGGRNVAKGTWPIENSPIEHRW